jgi:predicted GNAT family N-acyltransferase
MFKISFFLPNTNYSDSINQIRNQVFVIEQNVPTEEEFDGLDNISTQVLVGFDGKDIATSRIRITEKGLKLERFAVLIEYRKKGAGIWMLKEVLKYIVQHFPEQNYIYLHAQIQVIDFYKKLGFECVGELFYECEIAHYKMILKK